MRGYITIVLVFAILLFATPTLFDRAFPEIVQATVDFKEKITLYLTEQDKTVELTVEEYLTGCIFAQIPVNYHEEALRAQAVAAHTYALRLIKDGTAISDSASDCQPYFTEEQATEHYGTEYELYSDKVRRAAEYGAKRVITYDKEPIYAVYHSVSAGVTNTAFSVWGVDFPYLQSVGSSWDREYQHFLCVNEMTPDSMRLALLDYNKATAMPLDYSQWFTDVNKNDYGYVITAKAGDFTLSGGDMWRIFNFRSTSFDISYNGDAFSIETRGYGHGVGLSQYGADVLAQREYTCEEILKYYYKDVEIAEMPSK